ncbi:MAG: hypothetical protein HC884_08250 [Chloroflexaceae bacterium]|nr:hypothetical protein [Chloroflexaceae bacterium]
MPESLMLCERCGGAGAVPCEVKIWRPDGERAHSAETEVFALCPDCRAFVASIQPIRSDDEITGDSAWLAHIGPLTELANEISAMQRQMDRLRGRMMEKKKGLRLKVRQLEEQLNDAQWSRMIAHQRLEGETAVVFWLEKYGRR